MKRFMLFAYDHYHRDGGMYDFLDDFDTIEKCHAAIAKGYEVHWTADNGMLRGDYEHAHIYDLETRQIIETYQSPNLAVQLGLRQQGWVRVYAYE